MFQCSEEAWDKIFDVNVKSAFLLTKEVIPFLRKRGGGSIVYVSSIGGLSPFKVCEILNKYFKNTEHSVFHFFLSFHTSKILKKLVLCLFCILKGMY